MAFDQSTRNRLARFVSDARALLSEEFTRQLQNIYGIDPQNGEITSLERLAALNDLQRETARVLRETMAYYLAGKTVDKKTSIETLDRIVREQAFTVLNRLCALRMSEARGILLESVGSGYQSKGFQLYVRLASGALGETGEAYQAFIHSIMDEYASDLPALFERFSPQGRLFPRENALIGLLELMNDPEISMFWSEDETIGWIYQYFNSKEERKAMRDASQAPRNSRELAVRNQFFTPRYVVEFLTDNTLGRIWYEMTKGETGLRDSCQYLVCRPTEIFLQAGEAAPKVASVDEDISQEELLKQPVYIPHRPLKDPREIKMLDPACGSMHFGLYAFDLFELIYQEAWELEEKLGKDALWRLADLDALHNTYSDREAFLRDVPRLIIEHNIFGVDIDPRAVQIAGLSLWLRAQKSWQAWGVKSQERAQIRRSNIVCAEPMPGDRQMLDEFLATIKIDKLEELLSRSEKSSSAIKLRATRQMAEALAKLVRTVWQEMELAGEAGSLLKIEETLRDAIVAARKASEEKAPLFSVLEYGLNKLDKEGDTQLIFDQDQDFFGHAEELVLVALVDFIELADSVGGFKRRLFTEDAVNGFAFIDLCRKQYDVVVMNPPFGESSKNAKAYIETNYKNSKNDLYAAFVERWLRRLGVNGFLGAITSRTGFFLQSFQKWREDILIKDANPVVFADLGFGVLDTAMVETVAYCLQLGKPSKSLFFRLLATENKSCVLEESITHIRKNHLHHGAFFAKTDSFSKIPGSPFIYWISGTIRNLFVDLPSFQLNGIEVKQGLATADDFRFLRLWFEVPADKIGRDNHWAVFTKGSIGSEYYFDPQLVVNWAKNGAEIRNFDRAYIRNEDYQFKEGLTWPTRPHKRGYFSHVPDGSIFSHNNTMLFLDPSIIWPICAILNSDAYISLLHLLISRGSGDSGQTLTYEIGLVRSVPIPPLTEISKANLANLALTLYESERKESMYIECSHLFVMPEIFKFFDQNKTLDFLSSNWNDDAKSNNMFQIEQEINEIAFELYNINPADRLTLTNSLQDQRKHNILSDEDTKTSEIKTKLELVKSLMQFLVGCMYGRWDIRFTIGERTLPGLPATITSFSSYPLGILKNRHGLPITREDLLDNYPLPILSNGILVDDEEITENIIHYLRNLLFVIWGEWAEKIEAEACQILDLPSLRQYLQKPSSFFNDHLNHYSKSHRAAPIYWPLSTSSNSYTLWLYYHRLTDQTLFTCVNDFIDPKLKRVSEDSTRLRQKNVRSSADELEFERLADLERELKDFRKELLRVAAFWKPNLNDGVEITAAPLWKLFQHKAWQKRLKETWGKLEAGEYDWAYQAKSIWPERVREKCKSDKSLAIAHDLEHLYVEQKTTSKKSKKVAQTVEEETMNFKDIY